MISIMSYLLIVKTHPCFDENMDARRCAVLLVIVVSYQLRTYRDRNSTPFWSRKTEYYN